jgi:outer membrane protein W
MGVGGILRTSLAAVAALLLAAPPAPAQSASSVSVGLGLSVTTPTSADAGTDVGPSFVLRLRGGRGFGPYIGFNWFTTPVRTGVAGQRVHLGDVSVRPLLLGATYGHPLSRRLKLTASAGIGIAFAHARGTGDLKNAYAALGITGVGVKASDAFAWRLGTGVWIDLSRSVGMNLSIGYLGVQPEITITSGAGDHRRRLDLGSVVTSVGFTYGIF